MPALLLLFRSLWRALRVGWRRPEFRGLLSLVAGFVALGTVFYRFQEDFTWLDSAYFTVITLTTVGYGDLSPVTTLGKVFTAFYVIIGVGIIVGFAAELASAAMTASAERKGREA